MMDCFAWQFGRSQPKRNDAFRRNRGSKSGVRWLACFGLVSILGALSNADLAAQSQTMRFHHLQIEDGLSQTTIRSVLQDSRGFMWFGTQDGLNRYDGNSIRIFRPDPHFVEGLSNADIYTLLEDRDGYLWIGTAFGLNRFDRTTEEFTAFLHHPDDSSTISSNRISALFQSRDGTLWIGTAGGGLNSYDSEGGTFKRYPYGSDSANGISGDNVHAIFQDASGKLWIGVDGGVNTLDLETEQFAHHLQSNIHPDSISNNTVLAIHQDAQGTLWFGTRGDGLIAHEPVSGTRTLFSHNPSDSTSLSSNQVSAILEDANGTLWVGTDGAGLNRFDRASGRFARYRRDRANPESLNDDQVLSLAEDRSGVIWVGTYGRGIDRFDTRGAKFTAASSRHRIGSDGEDFVRAFLVDRYGELWIGREGTGISRINRSTGEITEYRHDPSDPTSVSNDRVFSVYEDRAGVIWIGTAGDGLNRFNRFDQTFKRYRVSLADTNAIGTGLVRAMLEDSKGRFWVAVDGGGLHLFDRATGVSQQFSHDPSNSTSLGGDRVFAVHESSSGEIWVATYGGGLNRLDDASGAFYRFRTVRGEANSLSSDYVLSIHEDSSDVLWIGSNGGGLDRFDPYELSFRNFGQREGLPNSAVYGIVGDDAGHLWLSHNTGLSRFDPETEEFTNYDVSDGLQSNEFNGGAYYRSADGELFFGGIQGFNAFFPDSIVNDPRVPPVVITDLQLKAQSIQVGEDEDGRTILSRSISETDELVLSYHDRVIAFEYAALFYGSKDKFEFAYMMEGLDDDWIHVGDRRFAMYTHVPPGRYTFRVKASNGDGVWNETGASIQVRITPPFWKTARFILLSFVVLAAAIWGVHQYRTRLIRVRARILEQSVQARTVELEREIAERKEVEERLAKAHDAALDATKSKSEFLATMSHEIRTPMNGVLGVVQLLLDTDLSVEQLDYARTIQSSGDTLLGIINDILDFSKVEAGKLDIEPIPFDLQVAASEVADLLTPKAVEKGIELVTLYHPDAPRYVVGDAGRIRQIILNLAGNAVKFTEKGHALIEVEGKEDLGDEVEVKISIHDTGIGIDEEGRARLFQSFSQADASTTRKFGGTGLGLAICKRLVELMGGEIGVESEPGAGSVFWFTLRLPKGEEPEVVLEDNVDLSDIRALVVDDTPVNCRVLSAQLTGLGMRPDCAGSGEEALRLLRKAVDEGDPYMMSILDFQMPGMNGEQLGKAIKNDPNIAGTSLVLMTSSGSRGDARRLREAGFAGYLNKTTCRDTIKDVVAAVVSNTGSGQGAVKLVTRHTVAEAQARPTDETAPDQAAEEVIVQRRVLLAEDNLVNQKVAMRMLEKLGCRVDIAANGREAVDMWSATEYEVVFMDCQMPELDGYGATDEIRKRETGVHHTPIIAMTANAMEGDRERCLDAGMDDYIAKPIRIEICREALERWIRPKRNTGQFRNKVA